MRCKRYLGLGLLLALASTSALGFQESAPPAAQQTEPAQAAPLTPDAALAPSAGSQSKPTGTEVRIPGLGRLGVLPKMDFGLELLYGASEPKPADDEQAPADVLTIRGTIKHPF